MMNSCPHPFLSQGGRCPLCAPPAPPVCTHDFLRENNAGLCPICHEALIAFDLPPDQLLAAVLNEKRERAAASARKSLAQFFRDAWHVLETTTDLEDSWHFDVLAHHLETMLAQWRALKRKKKQASEPAPSLAEHIQNLLVNIPPGTAKSRFVSVCFPAWAWLQDPSITFLAMSGNPSVAARDAEMTRLLVESAWYRDTFKPAWRLRVDRNAIGFYQIESTSGAVLGSRFSTGILSNIIGQRADCILFDDPHDPRSVVDGDNAALLRVINTWEKSFYNRVNNPALSMRVCIMQRVHKNDISAHMLAQTSQHWHHLEIPLTRGADYKENITGWVDPRAPGDVLVPTMFTPNVLEAERERLPDLYDALYEQAPLAFGGAIYKAKDFKWFRFADMVGPSNRPSGSNDDPPLIIEGTVNDYFQKIVISIDANSQENAKGASKAKGSDTGIEVWGTKGHDRFLLEDATAPIGFVEVIQVVKDLIARYPRCHKVIVENKALGAAVVAELRRWVSEVVAIEPQGGKVPRARACGPQIASGRVWILEGQKWNAPFCKQVYTFPMTPDGKNDRVDTMTQLLNHERDEDYLERLRILANG